MSFLNIAKSKTVHCLPLILKHGKKIYSIFLTNQIAWKHFLVLLVIVSTVSSARSENLTFLKKKHITIGFASQDLSSPVSMFGHTFLVLSDEFPPEPSSQAIEYVGKSINNSTKMFQAIFGELEDQIQLMDLFTKEREYNMQDRDLHFYELILSENEKNYLIKIIEQEISAHPKNSRYGFFKNNCSFVIYNWIIKTKKYEPHYTFAHVPTRGLKSLEDLGLFGKRYSKISTAKNLKNILNSLSNEEYDQFNFLKNGGNLQKNSSTSLIQGVNLYAAYRIHREPLESERNRLFKEIRPVIKLETTALNDPLTVFYSNWVNLSLGSNSKMAFTKIGYSPAIKNHYNYIQDDFKNSFLEMGRFSLLIDQKLKFYLEDLTLVELDSQPINNRLFFSAARYFKVGYDYFRGLEASFGIGFPMDLKFIQFGLVPIIGLRAFGLLNNESFKGPFNPQFGIRARIDIPISGSSIFRLNVFNYFIKSTNPEFRADTEWVLRFGRISPFIRARYISNYIDKKIWNELYAGVGYGF